MVPISFSDIVHEREILSMNLKNNKPANDFITQCEHP